MCALDSKCVEHPDAVVGPDIQVVVLIRFVRLPVTALIVIDATELCAEDRCGRGEVEVPKAGSVYLEHRLSVATDLVPQLDATNFD
jgi:hypothetical protein